MRNRPTLPVFAVATALLLVAFDRPAAVHAQTPNISAEPAPADRALGQAPPAQETTSNPAVVAAPAPQPPPPVQAAEPTAPKPVIVVPPSPEPTPAGGQAAEANAGLKIAARPGAYLKAQQKAIHAPFVAQTGTAIAVLPWPVTGSPIADLADGKAGKAPPWDIAEVSSDEAERACTAGQLETVEPGQLAAAADGTAIDKDFIAGGLTPCGAASVAWSSLVVFDRRAWPAQNLPAGRGARKSKSTTVPARTPSTLKDVFDTVAFPGKRVLRQEPRHLLEMSLLADGVAPEDIYRVLAGEEGTGRAFTRLEALRGAITWADTPATAGQLLAERKAVMAMLYSGRAFQHVGVEGKSYGLIWDGQIYHLEAWIIAKGTRQVRKAREFMVFATAPARLAAVAEQFPYGPARASAVSKVGRHAILKTDMQGFLPTAPANLRTAVQFDGRFWVAHERRLTERFEAWLKGPLPAPVATAVPALSPAPATPAANSGAPGGPSETPGPATGTGKSE